MTRWYVERASGKQVEPRATQTIKDHARRQDVDVGGAQLDREWQPIEAAADFSHDRRVVGGDRQIRSECAGALDKERHRRCFGKNVQRRQVLEVR